MHVCVRARAQLTLLQRQQGRLTEPKGGWSQVTPAQLVGGGDCNPTCARHHNRQRLHHHTQARLQRPLVYALQGQSRG